MEKNPTREREMEQMTGFIFAVADAAGGGK